MTSQTSWFCRTFVPNVHCINYRRTADGLQVSDLVADGIGKKFLSSMGVKLIRADTTLLSWNCFPMVPVKFRTVTTPAESTQATTWLLMLLLVKNTSLI